ncbi:unnamed protein product [Cylindrotheca closterium]|uniref:Uncharacterized protein n=1 Tax=Cylindrotheca closterium TaxID=2856 RepID=A0AAD2CPL9_9STRA|nr:unnamed protein product [Cylindrotheca closterium]
MPDSTKVRTQKASAGSVFDRLYKSSTAASRSRLKTHRAAARAPIKKIAVDEDCSKIFNRLYISGTISNTGKRVTPRHPSTPFKKTVRSPLNRTPAKTPSTKSRDSFVYSPRMKPLTKLTFKSKYHPSLGALDTPPLKLGMSFFQSFCQYETGEKDSKGLAKEIIVAFFKKDSPAGKQWELHDPCARRGAVPTREARSARRKLHI